MNLPGPLSPYEIASITDVLVANLISSGDVIFRLREDKVRCA